MRFNRDNNAQISIDFLIGVTIFILAFLFLMMALPKLFTPFQSNSDQLTMIADKVGATLVENELVATDAVGQPLPGIIDSYKINSLITTLSDSGGNEKTDTTAIDKRIELGLSKGDPSFSSSSNPNSIYHIQIELDEFDSTITHIEPFPKKFPLGGPESGGQNVGQSRRFVYIRNSVNIEGDTTKNWPGVRAIMTVRVW